MIGLSMTKMMVGVHTVLANGRQSRDVLPGSDADHDNSYRYAESDYESDSDMEAAGIDILEEEEYARRHAIKEDIEQERLEKEHAARKAATKKKLGKK